MIGGTMRKLSLIALISLILVGCGSKESSAPSAQQTSVPSDAKAAATPQALELKHQAYINAGMKYLQQSNISAAIKSFDSAIKVNPRDPRGYLVLGQTYLRLKQYDRAIDTFSAETRVAPQDGEGYYLLAVSYGLSGNKILAKENAEKSIKIFQEQKDQERFVRSVALLNGLSKEN
jgi:tetratricopeptide (TPR) repeat protein